MVPIWSAGSFFLLRISDVPIIVPTKAAGVKLSPRYGCYAKKETIRRILDAFSPPAHSPSSIAQAWTGLLTDREHDALELVVQRLHNKDIADKLFISTHTVKGPSKQHLQQARRQQPSTGR